MITGVHALIYASQPDEVREFFRDILGWSSVDAGGWPIFAMPPAELAVHPADEEAYELYLMCDDLRATMEQLEQRGVMFSKPVTEQSWGLVTSIRFPGGLKLALYEPRHPSPLA